MTDIDTIARSHAADTRSWLAEIEPPTFDPRSTVAASAVDRLDGVSRFTRRRWSATWAFAAGFMVVIAAGVVMVALSLGGGDSDLAGVDLRPIELGLGYVWPAEPGSSSPEALGAAFAVEVLGWDGVTVESASGSDPSGPVWVQVSAPGRDPIDILTAPHFGPGRVVHQIGAPSVVYAVVPGELGATGIRLVQPPGTTHAEVTVRLIGSDSEVVLFADADDLAAGRVETSEIPDGQQVATVLVRYLDNNGDVITATGGDSYDPESAVGVDAYWEWAVADATELEAGVVGVTRLGPAPGFDAAEYGSIQRLLSEAEITDDWNLDRPDPEALAPIAYIGSMQESGTQLYMYRRDTVSGKELMLCLEDNRETSCTGTWDLRIESSDDERPLWLTAAGLVDSQPWNRIALAMLPKDASVVVVELTDGRSFSQRPRGGVAAFEIPGSEPVSVASIAVLDANANQIPIQEILSNN